MSGFDGLIFNGPPGVNVVLGQPNFAIDKTNGQMYVGANGVWSTDQHLLNVQGPQAALTTVTTAQTMFSYTIPVGLQNILNKTFLVQGQAMFSNGATTPAITIALKIGSTTLVSVVGANNANTNSNAPLNFGFTFQTTAIGATGTDEAHGWLENAVSAAWSAGVAVAAYTDGNNAASAAYDHTISNILTVTIAATAALTTVTPRQLLVFSGN